MFWTFLVFFLLFFGGNRGSAEQPAPPNLRNSNIYGTNITTVLLRKVHNFVVRQFENCTNNGERYKAHEEAEGCK